MAASNVCSLGAALSGSAVMSREMLERLRGGGGEGVVCDFGGLGVVVAVAAVLVGRSEDLRMESDL